MVFTAHNGVFEQYDKAMPKSYWMRNKKQTVNLLYDPPFALERQLEDQRLSSEHNRNPQFYNPTKVDKVRSEKIIAKTGASRAVAVKANVLNKIVREASGVHNYTIVAPPRELAPLTKADLENTDPETNPRMKSYAMESKQKPTLCSFGHRPSSASRTFHPATMKFRLKHGEIAGDTKKTGFGLPVAILKQVIHAPKIYLPGSSEQLEERLSQSNGGSKPGSPKTGSPKLGSPKMSQSDLNGLFFTPDEQSELLYNNKGGSKTRRSVKVAVEEEGSTSQATWISTQERKAAAAAAAGGGKKKQPGQLRPMEPSQLTTNTALTTTNGPAAIDRPEWDTAHHRIKVNPNEVYKLRVSGLNDLAQMPLADKLKRFAKLAVAESQFVPFCTEKQKTDKIIQSGVPYTVPPAVPLEGHPLYYDPWDVELNEVKRHRRETERREKELREAQRYQDHLASVPAVEYYPTTRLQKLQSKSKKSNTSSNSNAGSTVLGSLSSPGSPGSPPAQQQQQQSSPNAKYEPGKSSTSSAHGSIQKPHTLLSFAYPMTLKKLENDSLELLHEPSLTTNMSNTVVGAAVAPPPPVFTASSGVMDYATINRQYQFSQSLPSLENKMTMEADFKHAMKAAKKGDTNALYEFSMKEDGKPVARRNKRPGAKKAAGKGGSPSQKPLDDDLPVGVNNDADKRYLAMLEAEESFAMEKNESLVKEEEEEEEE